MDTGHSTYGNQRARESRESPSVLWEPLEARLLLNADLTGTAPTNPLEAALAPAAIQVDLTAGEQQPTQNDPSVLCSYSVAAVDVPTTENGAGAVLDQTPAESAEPQTPSPASSIQGVPAVPVEPGSVDPGVVPPVDQPDSGSGSSEPIAPLPADEQGPAPLPEAGSDPFAPLAGPNLTPYQPAGWSDEIVVSTHTGDYIDDSPLYSTNTLYADWAVINNGQVATAATFYTYLYVDGTLKGSWYTPAPLNPAWYALVTDINLGSLSVGSHTLRITTDATGTIPETNEADNSYTKTITIAGPNLTPYQPAGWSDKIVVSTHTGDSLDDSPLSTTDTLYVDWAAINNGLLATAATFYTYLYVDGTLKGSWYTAAPLNPTWYAFVTDINLGSLSAGSHTLRIVADATNTIPETNEGDNEYTKTITVGVPRPNLTPYRPASWSDKIVVSTHTGDYIDDTPLRTTDTLYLDWSIINNGQLATTASVATYLYLDGTLKQTWATTPGINPNVYITWSDFNLGSLSAGSHTLRLVADATNTVAESNEGDNEYTKTITVGTGTVPWAIGYYLAHGGDLQIYQAAKFAAIANGAANANVQPWLLYDFFSGSQDAIFRITSSKTSPSQYVRGTDMWYTTDLGLPAEVNMGDPSSLSTFMNWVIDHSPANHYALSLFDHGSGWKSTTSAPDAPAAPLGICYDGSDYLTVNELGTAYAAIDSHLGRNIEVSYLDACLMQMIEVGYQIRDSNDLLVSNTNLGWVTSPTYENNYLSTITSSTSALTLATSIATAYHNWLAGWSPSPLGHAASIIDLTQIGSVYSALQTLDTRLMAALAGHKSQITTARANTQKYDEDSGDGILTNNDAFVDLKHFAQRLQIDVTGSDTAAADVRNAAAALVSAMGSAYIRYTASTDGSGYTFPNALGQSIYFPVASTHVWYPYYNNNTLSFCAGNWDDFLQSYFAVSPDLAWNSLSASPGSVAPGGTLTISRSYQVSGAAVSPNFTIQYRLSPNATWGDADDVILTPDQSLTAAADKTVGAHSGTFTVTVPGSTTANTYYLLARVDNGNTVAESNENNNVIVDGQITVIPVSPDLSWNSLSGSPGSIAPGGTLTVSRSYQVSGVAVSPNFTIQYRLSPNATWGDADDVILTPDQSLTAAADKTVGAHSGTFTVTVPGSTMANTYYLLARVDNGNAVAESNENNNVIVGGQITINPVVPVTVTIAVSPTSVPEDGTANLVYTFARSTAGISALTVNFSVGGTATFNTDYTQTGAASFSATAGAVTILAGQTTAIVAVDPTLDTTVEPDETVILTVAPGTGYMSGTPATATGTILNDDPSVSQNLALGKTAVASTSYPGYSPSAVTDGNLATRWSSEFSDNQWIYVDLGAVYTINRVVLQWEAAYGRTYSIQVSNDAFNWSTVYSTTTGDGSVDDISVSGSGRYVRMLGSQRATEYGYALWEFEVYGGGGTVAPEITVLGNGVPIADGDTTPGATDYTDFGTVAPGGTPISRTFTVRNDGTAALTLGAVTVPAGFTLTEGLSGSLTPGASDTFTVRLDTATAGTKTGDISFATNDSDENPFNFRITGTVQESGGNLALGKTAVASTSYAGFGPSNATDGIPTSRWSSQFSDNEWIYVDLGSSYAINRVVLRWEAAYGRGYKIQVSGNASAWSDVYSTTTGDGSVDDITLNASGRYVRMLGAQRATMYGYSLWEFEVYGSGTPPVNQPPTISSFSKSGTKDTPLPFAAGDFSAAFADPDAGDSLQKIKITVLPSHGVLRLGGTAVTVNQEVVTAQIGTLAYTPDTGYAGTDSFRWNGSDGSLYAVADATVNLSITAGDGTNLALHKPAVASTSYTGLPSSNATDGNINSRWSSLFSDSEWIYVDLGSVYTVNRVVLRWEAAYGRAYKVQVSTDASTWSDVYTTAAGDGNVDDIALNSPASGRYVRMLGTQRATVYGYSLYELEVYAQAAPPNLALYKPATASTSYPGLPASNATDGNAATRWSSQFSDSEWLYVDLGSVFTIRQVVLRWEAAYGKGYRLQVSSDASSWSDVYTTTTGDGGVDDITLASPASGRYVRLLGLQRATVYGYSLWEFEVYA